VEFSSQIEPGEFHLKRSKFTEQKIIKILTESEKQCTSSRAMPFNTASVKAAIISGKPNKVLWMPQH
jgi:hypothetical protein